MNRTALRGIILICFMKLLNKIIENRFAIQDPAKFRWEDSTSGSRIENGSGACHFNSTIQIDISQSSLTTWIYTIRYMFPVIGGLMSSAHLGYIRVLQIGGVITLMSTILMSVAVYLGLMCQSASPIIPITSLLLPMIIGLIQPNILYGFFRWQENFRTCTVVSALYVFTATFSEWIGLMLQNVNELGDHLTVLFNAVSALFIASSFLLPKEANEEPFEMPTIPRMIKYFRIFSGFLPFLISMDDTRPAMYNLELKYYLNETNYFESHHKYLLSPDRLKDLSLGFVALLLMLVAFVSPRRIPMQPRMQAGFLLEATVSLCLIIFTCAGSPNPTAAVIVFSAASIIDSIAEILVLSTAYDLMYRIAPSNSKAFVMGIMFSVMGFTNIASRLLLILLGTHPRDNPVLHPAAGTRTQFYVYHLTILIGLVVCSIYHKLVIFPLALQLIPESDDGLQQEDDERQHLVIQSED